MPKAKVGSLEMYYEVHGSGPALVMIMGLGANAAHWDPPVVRAFAHHFSVVLFDNRDAGRTTGPETAYTVKDMADDVVGLMDHLGLDKAHVLGISMGGMIAQEVALGHPQRVDHLILGCTTCGVVRGVAPSQEVLDVLMRPAAGGRMSLATAIATSRIVLAPGWLWKHFYRLPELALRVGRYPTRPEGYARQLGAIGAFDTAPRLGRIQAPTLILHGDRDVLLPPENAHILASLIPGSRLVIFPGAAHMFNTENPGLFQKTVLDFLGRTRQAPE